MSEFGEIALGYPTVVLSVLLLVAVVFWLLSLVGLVADTGDLEVDTGDPGPGALSDLLAFLRLDGAPVTLTLTVWTLMSWFCCFVTASALGLDAPDSVATVALATAVLLASVVVGLLPTVALARPLARGVRRLDSGTSSGTDVLGRTCRVTTGRVTEDFGQAVVTLADGTTDMVQVRTAPGAAGGLGYDSVALLLEYDASQRTYLVQPAPAFLVGPDDAEGPAPAS